MDINKTKIKLSQLSTQDFNLLKSAVETERQRRNIKSTPISERRTLFEHLEGDVFYKHHGMFEYECEMEY